MRNSIHNNTGLANGQPFERHEIEQLASDVVQLHLGVHTILYQQPLAFLECLARELRQWSLPDDAEAVMAAMLPEADHKALAMILALTTDETGGLARV